MSDKKVGDVIPATKDLVKQTEGEGDVQNKSPEGKLGDFDTTTSGDASRLTDSNEKSGATSSGDKSIVNDRPDIIYEGDKCISVDPITKARYVWNEERAEWISESQGTSQPEFSSSNNYQFDGTTYNYEDPVTKINYKWDVEKNAWTSVNEEQVTKTNESKAGNNNTDTSIAAKDKGTSDSRAPGGVYGYENDTHTYTDPSDNTVYIWDREKNAWFPKVDEEFLAHYQMNYGFVDESKNEDNKESDKTDEKEPDINDTKAEKRKAPPQPPSWFDVDDENNTKVYVNNLPMDITEQEFVDLMQKCGLVMKDPDNNKMKVKLYTDAESKLLKGDGLCTYIRKESVDLALNLLDGSEYRGRKLHVEKAKFTMKGGAYDPSLKPKKKKRKDKEKIKKMQERLFDWHPDKLRGERSRNESIVIIKNLFEPGMFDKDVKLILEFQQDLREECIKCGAVKKVIIYDRNVEGVAQVNFKEPEAADACIQLLNGRWFNKRQISAQTWDGKTKYRVVETEAQKKERLEKWNKYLHSEENPNNKPTQIQDQKSENKKIENGNKESEETVEEDSDSDNVEEEM